MQITLAPLKPSNGSVTDQVFDALYGAIISVELPPGTKVSEAELAKELDVSRQPVRDAFFRLSNLGFLSIRPQRATLITQISRRAIRDALFTRTALEVECLRQALAKNKSRLIAALDANIQLQHGALSQDAAKFYALDEAFHELICTVSGHDHVWPLIREQKGHLDRLRFLSLSHKRQQFVVAEHSEILGAIMTGVGADAELRLRAHILDVEQVLPSIAERHPDYFETVDEGAKHQTG
ncbi:GntR family transcriptional regulator [Octadecabacter sp. G9-8]|uniref:GntR family transcriptional regulator n=1 Tax=Octadecabacter dasysiphoniae TaxID=2909341 RepID=A0ABS9CW52_9RHOB|nr:GntR family transcriptional regulator [Octadecabacter dasysiphoniae]MCF2871181.1 GntR family transcriptional regulator [Octadecabacter dasysiphoniae]